MVIKMGTGAVSWSSRLQTIATLSTTEAEYVSAVSAGQEMIWLRNLLTEFGYQFNGVLMYEGSVMVVCICGSVISFSVIF